MMARNPFPSSEDEDGTLDYPQQRWIPKGVMPSCHVAGSFKSLKSEEISLNIEEIRNRFNIPGSVVISLHDSLQHPAESNKVVASFYQLEYGLLMPIDAEMCEILTGWGISLQQLHPSILVSIRRLLTIARVFCSHLLPRDVHRIISPTPRDWGKGAGICFICTWVDNQRRLYGFPGSYKNWEIPCFKFANWQSDHRLGIPYKLASSSLKSGRVLPDFESDQRIRRLFDLPTDLFNVSYPDSIVQLIYNRERVFGHISAATPVVPVAQYPAPPSSGQSSQEQANSKKRHSSFSSSSGILRIPRKRHCPTAGINEAQISTPRTNGVRGFRRLRKTHQDYRAHRINRDAESLIRNVTHIPDAMSEKVCVVARRCQRLFHKNYNFVEESVCASSGAFVTGLAENRESTNSGFSNNDPGFENESSEGISSGGPPSPFPNLNAAHAPLGREAMRGNDLSNTVFIDDSSPSDDNISVARNDFLPPGRKEPTCNNGGKVIQSTFPIGSSFNSHVLSDHGLLGSGSTDPILANESARVCRPPSIPIPDVDDGMVCQPPSISVPNVDGETISQPHSIPVPDVDGGNCPYSSRTPVLPVKEPDYESLQNAVTKYYTQFMNSVNQLKEVHRWRVVLMPMRGKKSHGWRVKMPSCLPL
ncbi:hypothetical protein MKX03_016793 [Papaver bracteatum]|nr:hypothetical protein MKX03_016793 [Papaver bracteatum]